MKTNKIIIASLMAVGMLFAACTEEAPLREVSPADKGTTYFAADNATAIEVEPNTTFTVTVCREATAESATVELTYTESVEGAFTLDPKVTFAAGDSVATIVVALNSAVKAGEVATLTLTIPETAATYYAAHSFPTLDVNVTAGYLWLPAGTAMFTSGICSAGFGQTMTAEVEVQYASDFVSAEGDKLYRLISPYYHVSQGILCTTPGWHISFLLDKDNAAKELKIKQGMYQIFDTDLLSGIMYMYWDLVNYGSYNVFFNQGNIYCIQTIMSDGEGLYGPYQEYWQWTPPTE